MVQLKGWGRVTFPSWEQQGAAGVGLQPVSGHSPDLLLKIARPDTPEARPFTAGGLIPARNAYLMK